MLLAPSSAPPRPVGPGSSCGCSPSPPSGAAARARKELRGFIDAESRFLRKYVPGFENSTLMDVGRFVGVRDGRHLLRLRVEPPNALVIEIAEVERAVRPARAAKVPAPVPRDHHSQIAIEDDRFRLWRHAAEAETVVPIDFEDPLAQFQPERTLETAKPKARGSSEAMECLAIFTQPGE